MRDEPKFCSTHPAPHFSIFKIILAGGMSRTEAREVEFFPFKRLRCNQEHEQFTFILVWNKGKYLIVGIAADEIGQQDTFRIHYEYLHAPYNFTLI